MPKDDTREDTVINILICAAVHMIRRKRDLIDTIYCSITFTITVILVACGTLWKKNHYCSLVLVRQKICPRLKLALREFQ